LNDFFFARSQMGMSLAFNIVFAVIGMAMPLLMAVSEDCYLWTKKPIFLELSKRWAGRDGDSVRGRGCVWYGPFVRAGTAMAEVYAICRRDHSD
jgi:hypothetical protein